MTRTWWLVPLCGAILGPGKCAAQKLGTGSLFSDYKAFRVGDVVTIYIVEFASGTNETKTGTGKETEISLESSGGTGALKFLPMFGAGANARSKFDGKGSTSTTGVLRAKISARVVQVLDNGNLVIEGSREVQVNNEKQVTILSGVVRPEDITADNVVYSYNIADAKITYRGKGVVSGGSNPSLITRILNWVF
ncbi:MAG: flagellar basal body L-ring protein FlgH [candidate division KSB1 bacterium]|nr:flagellar basal body L-ring protein FlgH [candidate division KSB1 bacterium]